MGLNLRPARDSVDRHNEEQEACRALLKKIAQYAITRTLGAKQRCGKKKSTFT